MPRSLGFTNYLIDSVSRLRNSVIWVDLASPCDFGLKIIYTIILLTTARLRNSFICVNLTSPGFLGVKII